MDVKDKVFIITGSGRGIGAAAAELCAQNGARVVICDINDQWGQKVLDKICAQDQEASYFHVDVSKEAEVEALVNFTVEKYGKLDGIVNNAATIVVKPVADLTAEEWDKVIGVNLTGVFYGCKHAIRQFLKQGTGGSIVNVGSISAVVGLYEQPVYCASKGGVYQLSRQIAVEYAKKNIRCNIISPGSVDGEFVQIYLDGQVDPRAAAERQMASHPMGRFATPREVAETIMFMLSDRSTFVTGANLMVDGGYSAI
jgi:NAD(P)-dependent dehydrogenase (short-subunit alcohol dehydrogenase family)